MKTFYILLLTFLFLKLNGQDTINSIIIHDDLERSFITYTSKTYNEGTKSPLLIMYHGMTGDAESFMHSSKFIPIAEKNNFILVFPQGEIWNDVTHWNVGELTEGSPIDDIGFSLELIEHLKEQYSIDEDKIYVGGASNGGFLSFQLACEHSDKIAAIASVCGSMTPQTFQDCNPNRPVPVIQLHGTEDNLVPYEGNWFSIPVVGLLDFWAGINNCTSATNITEYPDIYEQDGSYIESIEYLDCQYGKSLKHLKIIGGSHSWPSYEPTFPYANRDIETSEIIWEFLSMYSLEGNLSSAETQTNSLQVYPNPVIDNLSIDNLDNQAVEYIIYSSDVSVIIKGEVSHLKSTINLSSLSSGLYFIKIEDSTVKFIKV